MLPELPLLVKCQHCGTLVWIREQREVKNIGGAYLGEGYSPLMPTLEDYAVFLEKGVNDWKKECYVRHHAWWVGNDPRRESSQTPLNSFEIENLRAFIPLLNESEDDDRLTKAEAFREIGEFAEAEKLLATKFGEQLQDVVSFIRDLNQKKITIVQEIQF